MPDTDRKETVVNVKRLSHALNLTDRQVQNLATSGIIPKAKRGEYPFIRSIQGYILYLKNEKGGGNQADEFNLAKTRDMSAKAQLNELKLKREHGRLILVSEMLSAWQTIVERFRDQVNTLPERTTPRIMGARSRQDVKKILEEAIWQILEELSRTEIETESGNPASAD